MDPIAKNLVPIRIQDEMRNSYMDYSMSVIIGRALPDVRDGLKPVHRRILYAMHNMGLAPNKKYVKCAGVVGEVLKSLHPHGDSAVYDALVRMAQHWNLRYMMVDGQGNFGSVDGDPAAAYRYTECRMTKHAVEMLVDIDKETVGFQDNFDGSSQEPEVLPSRLPNLLVNGSDGIAVGMATKIPPHNLGEIVDACIATIENPDITVDELLSIVPGPDFPTAGTIYGRKGVRDAYETGRGRVIVRGNAFFEDVTKERQAIIIDELPYQVNKARLLEQIADLVRDKRLDGISALRDESDRTGMRVVIELKVDAFPEVVLNHLYKHTPLQSTFGVIMLAIVNQRPRVLTLREMLGHFIAHRRDVIARRTRYLLRKAQERAHLVEGYLKALDFIDEVISIIRGSSNVGEARLRLIARFDFSVVQADAILEMRLQRLTGMERQKLLDEYGELEVKIAYYEEILGSEVVLMGVVMEELQEVRGLYADERRTRIVDSRAELTLHDLVAAEDQIVTMSHLGYIKRTNPDEWRMQKRGGMGKRGMRTRDEDFVTSLMVANTHDLLLVFTSAGRVLPLDVHRVPEAGGQGKGKPIVNLVPINKDERIASVVAVQGFQELVEAEDGGPELLFVTRRGRVKRTALREYRNMRTSGLIATGIREGDELVQVRLVDDPEESQVMLLTRLGQSIRFSLNKDELRPMGRPASGNMGIQLRDGDEVVHGLLLTPQQAAEQADDDVDDDDDDGELELALDAEEGEVTEGSPHRVLLVITEGGYGKRTPLKAFRSQKRNGKGIRSARLDDRSGGVVGGELVTADDQLMLVTDTGRVIRVAADSVGVYGRAARGVRVMRLDDDERIVDLALLAEPEEDEEEEEVAETESSDDVSSGGSDGEESSESSEDDTPPQDVSGSSDADPDGT